MLAYWQQYTSANNVLRCCTRPPLLLPLVTHFTQVRVTMKAVGICGSDVHYLKHGRIGDFVVNAPMVIGHESAGVVTEVGPDCVQLAYVCRLVAVVERPLACLQVGRVRIACPLGTLS